MDFYKICHMITPGLDSICAYFYIIEKCMTPGMELELIHVGLSPSYSHIEEAKLGYIKSRGWINQPIRMLKIPDVRSFIQEDPDAFIPSRNLLLATLIDATAIPDRHYSNLISFGFNSDDRVYDSSDVFCELVSSVLSPGVSMGSLVRHLSKSELLKWFIMESNTLTKEEKYELIDNTYSCYSGEETECLKCNACFRKNVALCEIGNVREMNDFNFLHKRLSILNDESVSIERKRNIIQYVSHLVSQYDRYAEFSKYIKEI